MADYTTVKITYGDLEATLRLSYRWYVQGADPWELLDGMHIVPYGGWWQDRGYWDGHKDRFLEDKKHNLALELEKFDRTKVGSWGTGVFHNHGGTWYNIPKMATINWEIISYD